MERTVQKKSQNVNDSLHSKLWRLVATFKSHGKKRYNFACKMVMMIQNFGYERSFLLHVLDMMTISTQQFLS